MGAVLFFIYFWVCLGGFGFSHLRFVGCFELMGMWDGLVGGWVFELWLLVDSLCFEICVWRKVFFFFLFFGGFLMFLMFFVFDVLCFLKSHFCWQRVEPVVWWRSDASCSYGVVGSCRISPESWYGGGDLLFLFSCFWLLDG